MLLLMLVLFSCNSREPPGIDDPANYTFVRNETVETGSGREIYVFGSDSRYTLIKTYWPEGKIWRESFMKDYRLHGLSRTYTPDGKPDVFIEFKNGLKDGKLAIYDDNGGVKKIEIYKKGKQVQ